MRLGTSSFRWSGAGPTNSFSRRGQEKDGEGREKKKHGNQVRTEEKRGKSFVDAVCLSSPFLLPYSVKFILMESRSDSFQVRMIRQSLIQVGKLFLRKMRT